MDKRLLDAKWREVPFEIMLKCDEEIKCECWLLSNSINKYGVDLRQPMMFNNFLRLIGTHLTSMNCKSLFGQAKWYVIDDGVQPDFFLNKHTDPIPPTIKMGDKVKHPEILEPVTVISIGEEWTVVQDYLGYRYDVRFSDLEISHD